MNRLSIPLASFLGTTAIACLLSLPAGAASLSSSAQAVLPQTTMQVVSVAYQRLNANPDAVQVEKHVLPGGMQNAAAILKRGGLNPTRDLSRLTFATTRQGKQILMIGIAEGNFIGLKRTAYFHPTKKHPHPPQYQGRNVYTSNGLEFFFPDPNVMVFGTRDAVHTAIDTELGIHHPLSQNEQMTDLIDGTETTDLWSVLDATGAQNVVRDLLTSSGATQINPSLLAHRFTGARYTISFDNPIQLNLELMTQDDLTAATLSTGLRAALAYRVHQEKNPAIRSILQNTEVDSTGDHAFIQVSTDPQTVASLVQSDLFQSITR